ncbi:hypothetical protein QQS21_004088 [Conoideocrella luteorostrata]|uniref:Phospholipase/carboxylesterase/thioesterase domain-containing protein n=1 Tax=Conoideocrella luteorostrata TaxID=1105319 RepID=A0AAJ0CS40_9HYPO|nr:hypothetical protein QQS21_004088 [Conoideocrella luteorostrata]
MPPRIPTQTDFSSLPPMLHTALHFPQPPESTTALLILFHGLGDSEAPFATFARSMSLPGVLAISVRGTSPLPQSLLDSPIPGDQVHCHWGDDIVLDERTGELDPDPGFAKASRLVMEKLVGEVLIDRCGWEMEDILFFGFGQGGSLGLGLGARLGSERVVDVSGGASEQAQTFKGVVSVGGGLPLSMVSSRSGRERRDTHVLLCQVDEDKEEAVKREFKNVSVVRWKRKEVAMPRDRDEMFPIMKFFADRLKSGW